MKSWMVLICALALAACDGGGGASAPKLNAGERALLDAAFRPCLIAKHRFAGYDQLARTTRAMSAEELASLAGPVALAEFSRQAEILAGQPKAEQQRAIQAMRELCIYEATGQIPRGAIQQ